MKQFNPTEQQLQLFRDISDDTEKRIATLNDLIARLEGAIVALPATNENGLPIRNGVNQAINDLIGKYKLEINMLMMISTKWGNV